MSRKILFERAFLGIVFTCIMSTSSVLALSLGGAAGMDFPISHTHSTSPGVAAEGFYRLDPYEVRFHFSHIDVDTYSVLLSMKHFFSDTLIRPYVEGAMGPLIVNTKGRGLGYGIKPEVSLGADLGITSHFSTGVVARYFGLVYFGSTSIGKFEANHGFSLMGNLIVWF